METGLFTNNSNGIVNSPYKTKTVSYAGNTENSEEKNTDSFEKTVDDMLSGNGYKDYQQRLKQRRQEIQREQQLAVELRAERRRKLKLLLKKHEDYVRFLEGTAMKKSLAERERIENPKASESEINSLTPSAFDAKMPLFIRVK